VDFHSVAFLKPCANRRTWRKNETATSVAWARLTGLAAPTPVSPPTDGSTTAALLRALLEHYGPSRRARRTDQRPARVNGGRNRPTGTPSWSAQVAVGCGWRGAFPGGHRLQRSFQPRRAVTELAGTPPRGSVPMGVLTDAAALLRHPTQAEILRFYEENRQAAGTPADRLQTGLGGTTVEIELDTALGIAELDHVVGDQEQHRQAVSSSSITSRRSPGTVKIFSSPDQPARPGDHAQPSGVTATSTAAAWARPTPVSLFFGRACGRGRADAAAQHADKYWALTSGWT